MKPLFASLALFFGLAPTTQAQTAKPLSTQVLAHETLQDKRINESSGLMRSARFPRHFWTHNDSGDTARVFLMDEKGATRLVVNLVNARNIDWEDGAARGGWVYLGDIGDNNGARAFITIYRFREPAHRLLSTQQNESAPVLSLFAEEMTLRYPDGAQDAESLIIAPDGRVLIVTKSLMGSKVFIAPKPFQNGATQTLKSIARLTFPEGGFMGAMATAADISADNSKVAVRTYTHIYEWKRNPRDNSDAGWWKTFQAAPRVLSAPPMAQAESLCYDVRGHFVVGSEKVPSPLFFLK